MNYSRYEVEDFIADPYFQEWVLGTDEMVNSFWVTWMKEHREKKETIEEAARFIQELRFKQKPLSTEEFHEIWKDIITNRETHHYKLPKQSSYQHRKWVSVAAVFLAIVIAGTFYFIEFGNTQTNFHTDFSETKEIQLPDGSLAILNANSHLSFDNDWEKHTDREITLKGEAYFSVIHTKNNQKFIVRSGDLNIEVLGTKFNVSNRRGKNKVVLEEGSVKLDLTDIIDPNKNDRHQMIDNSLIMEPGEMVEISQEKQEISKKIVDPNIYLSWTQNILIFDNTPLGEIIKLIEDNYGYAVYTEGLNMNGLEFSGELHSTDLDLILDYLSEAFDLQVKKNDKKIILMKNKRGK